MKGFEEALNRQRMRSKKDATKKVGDWRVVHAGLEVEFVGYDQLSVPQAKILKYRSIDQKGKQIFQLVLSTTPFYAEGGGQIGDTGYLMVGDQKIHVLDTQRENELIIHKVDQLPLEVKADVFAQVDVSRRKKIERNHSATHLLHAALREVLGTHVHQKGSLVSDKYLRFDFSHFEKIKEKDLLQIENLVNRKIRENIDRMEDRSIPIEKAKEKGAMMLFGEKYGDEVRVITFDPDYSMELCGGCHVPRSGHIGSLKITQETSVASGIRRIEALSGQSAQDYIQNEEQDLREIRRLLKNPQDVVQSIELLQEENKELQRAIEQWQNQKASGLKDELVEAAIALEDFQLIVQKVEVSNGKTFKKLAHELLDELEQPVIVLGAEIEGKAQLIVAIEKTLAEKKNWNAGSIIRDCAPLISGGGGGQPFFASAGGKNPAGIEEALQCAKKVFYNE
jgi:alanyl-tRNA synthetase